MSESSIQQARLVFDAVVDLPAPQRSGAIERLGESDANARVIVERMLAAHDRGLGRFLEGSAPWAAYVGDEIAEAAPVPARIGAYQIVRVLGEGGMGVVYEARQERPARVIALKVIRSEFPAPDALRRFEFESEVLARLQHPGIAHVYEAGLAEVEAGDGRRPRLPYFAMELIRGRTLTDHVRAEETNVLGRIDLIISVCDAVRHAHQRGVIHRDLKPANVIVDESGRPKILDFGIARIVDPDGEAATTRAETGQVLGTLAYMSPEQIVGPQRDVDTRADVYALGVILYELLTGRPPHDVKGVGLAEAARRIRDEDPPRPRSLTPGIARDLEAIVLRAIEKERSRRYGSAAELSDDLQRFLHHEPVAAQAPGGWYLLRKAMRRHRAATTLAAGLTMTVIVSTIALTLMYREQSRQRDRAQGEAQKAQDVVATLQAMLGAANPEGGRGRDYTVVQMLDDFAADGRRLWAGRPDTEATVRQTMGAAYRGLAEFDKADEHLQAALALRRAEFGEEHPSVAGVLVELSRLRHLQARYEEADALARRALDIRRKRLGESHVDVAASLDQVASNLLAQGRYAEAEPVYQQALRMRRDLLGPEHQAVGATLNNLGLVAQHRGDFATAEPYYDEALRIRVAALGNVHPDVAETQFNLASLHQARGNLIDAERLYQSAVDVNASVFGPDHVEVAWNLTGLGSVQRSLCRFEEAERTYRRVIGIWEKSSGRTHPALAVALGNLGNVLFDLGRFTEAEALNREALQIQQRQFPEGHPGEANYRANLGSALRGQGRFEEAEVELNRAQAIIAANHAPEHPRFSTLYGSMARLARDRGDLVAAESLYARVVQRFAKERGPDYPATLLHQAEWADVLSCLGEQDRALMLASDADARARDSLSERHLVRGDTTLALGLVLFRGGSDRDIAQAVALLEESLSVREEALPGGHWRIGEAAHALGRALARTAATEAAHAQLENAVKILEAALGPDHPETREARASLTALSFESGANSGGS
ncbi:MAG: serine/threonine-protein kinase [Phycisphaerae bacterium]|nr:MAG: serine/threonine protein kinase [Phycisphaerae bacterium]MBE7456390.1 serine/threonine protein kinase [Planctomycetia bacterium]MCK6466221.1 serine/threonine-protein kinase [Phycisphaerae bacterium]MCL4719948.1 serine/threonine-protein kinase [Phycisphaerae bacterium]NUQ10268.1 serine/threonine protein kinase [Phycisphaerae bacterium]